MFESGSFTQQEMDNAQNKNEFLAYADLKTLVEILAIIGGNMALFAKIETTIGKIMLNVCHQCKVRSERKRRMSDAAEEHGIEIQEVIP